MISQQTFQLVIDAQTEFFKKKSFGIERNILSTINHAVGFASIITGIRRSGKSTLMMQLYKETFKEKALFLNFEDPRLANIDIADFERLYAEILKREIKLIFFDEIQLVSGWEVFVNQLLREDFLVFITGSNATLLSKELGTHLTGRHFSTELFPFSYTEFLLFFKLKADDKSFQQYLQKGGMPDYLRTNIGKYLNDLLDDILIRDIAIRYGLRDVNSLRQLAVYLISNIGCPISANGLNGMFGIKSTTTLLSYFSYLQDAYILEFVSMYDYSLKKQLRNPQKVYAIDLGIYHHNKITFSENLGRVLENAVYLFLRQSNKEIFYFQGKGECDFVVANNGKPTALYQVSLELNSMNLDRELKGLFEAMRYFKINKAKIITLNQSDVFKEDDLMVEVLPAWQWMSQ
jgi:uncharacterized protein